MLFMSNWNIQLFPQNSNCFTIFSKSTKMDLFWSLNNQQCPVLNTFLKRMCCRGMLHSLPSEGKRDLCAAALRNHFTLYAKAALPLNGIRSIQWQGVCLCLCTRHQTAGCVSVDHAVDQKYGWCHEQKMYSKNSFSDLMHCSMKNCIHMMLGRLSMLTYFSVCDWCRSCLCNNVSSFVRLLLATWVNIYVNVFSNTVHALIH